MIAEEADRENPSISLVRVQKIEKIIKKKKMMMGYRWEEKVCNVEHDTVAVAMWATTDPKLVDFKFSLCPLFKTQHRF